jgi:hypothetical protein
VCCYSSNGESGGGITLARTHIGGRRRRIKRDLAPSHRCTHAGSRLIRDRIK